MDAVNNPTVERIVVQSASQMAKTELLLNIIGYHIDQDPAPIMLVQPTVEIAQAWSKDRFDPMVRDTSCLSGRVREAKSKDSRNTILHKTFWGGNLTITGANSPASLAGRPKRILLCDELDRWPTGIGVEGDPLNLAIKRTTNFWNRKIVIVSTPTVRGISRIAKEIAASDKRFFHVPCPHCGHFQILLWKGRVKWPKKDGIYRWQEAMYKCVRCKRFFDDADRIASGRKGKWIATAEFNGTAGFTGLNALYSPWSLMPALAKEFLDANKSRETLQTFVNTTLGEEWEEGESVIEDGTLMGRREKFGPKVPALAAFLVTTVDTQIDRLELETVAYGPGEEAWQMDYRILMGSPAREQVWKDLDDYLLTPWRHELGATLTIGACGIDTGGRHTQEVYRFVKPRQVRRVYALKGANEHGVPIVAKARVQRPIRVKLFFIGTDTGKQMVHGRLGIQEHGPKYMHFSLDRDEDYFKQLLAEKPVPRTIKGRRVIVWEEIPGQRNEALDLRVYNLAVLYIVRPNLEKLSEDLRKNSDRVKAKGQEQATSTPIPDEEKEASPEEIAEARKEVLKTLRRGGFARRKKGGWATNW